MTLFEELKRRGLIAQTTNDEEVERRLNSDRISFYIGFDATADSLHVGHFLQLMVMRRMQKAGHRPIALLGGGTTMVGDPSGRTDMRKMLTKADIDYNANCFKEQMRRFLDFSDGGAMMLNNDAWLMNLNYIDFLRDIGVHFSVNKMIAADCFKTRLEKGLSFIEFNYMLMQSYDFLKLYQDYGCCFQLGGSDQWGNIISGVDLVRRVEGTEVFGMTFTLLTTKEGKKMGKTQGGAVWLDRSKTSPYDFFQYWRNVDDADVVNCMKMLTEIPIEEIEQYDRYSGEQLNPVKERLAYELTKLVHGEADAEAALAASKSVFGGNGESGDIPSSRLDDSVFIDGAISICELIVACSLAPSKGEARRLVEQGGVSVDDVKITDTKKLFAKSELDGAIIKKGKKVFHRVEL